MRAQQLLLSAAECVGQVGIIHRDVKPENWCTNLDQDEGVSASLSVLSQLVSQSVSDSGSQTASHAVK